MPKFVRCETCGKEGETNAYGATPAPWIDITERMPGTIPDEYAIVCSRSCGIALLSRTRPVAEPLEPPVYQRTADDADEERTRILALVEPLPETDIKF